MPLTDLKIRNLKPGPTTQKLSDGQGLQLWLSPAGSRSWKLAYRHGGKQRKAELGPYPLVTLSEARDKRDAAKKLLTSGVDPVEHGKAAKAEAAAASAVETTTFRSVAMELLQKKTLEGKAPNTISKLTWLLGLACDDLGEMPITAIKAPKILVMLRKLETQEKLESARRLRSLTSEVFRYGISTGQAEIDPAAMLVGALRPPKVEHRAAITDRAAFGGLLRAIDNFQGQATTRAALQLMALLFCRPGELRLAEWSEFDFTERTWLIPALRTKMRKPHLVPLAPQATAIIEGLRPLTGKGRLLLPGYGVSGGEGRRIEQRPLSENTMLAAILRMGYERHEHSAHGFRASASTLLYESGKWSGDAIEAQLAHTDSNSVRRAYKRSVHWPERVGMMSWWADELDRLRGLKPGRG